MLADVFHQASQISTPAVAIVYCLHYLLYLSHLSMVWCACPICCKGGRNVSQRTFSRHEKELQDKEDQELLQKYFPDHAALLSDAPRRRCRANDNDTQGSHSKKVRRSDRQGGNAEIQSVGAAMNFTRLNLTLR